MLIKTNANHQYIAPKNTVTSTCHGFVLQNNAEPNLLEGTKLVIPDNSTFSLHMKSSNQNDTYVWNANIIMT